jgi:hypothetical protein
VCVVNKERARWTPGVWEKYRLYTDCTEQGPERNLGHFALNHKSGFSVRKE